MTADGVTDPVTLWHQMHGLLASDLDPVFPMHLYGICGDEPLAPRQKGALFGFVAAGELIVNDGKICWRVGRGEWFATRSLATLQGSDDAVGFVAQRLGFCGLYARGGPLEERGRLRYIDGCSDTLLCGPPVAGDPCLNLLHFPPATDQTMHTHPSARVGMVVSGSGLCRTETGELALMPGQVFALRPYAQHAFATTEQVLNVIAWHPDSDWGPTHEAHPMLNRTWVAGRSVDNHDSRHRADLIRGELEP